MDTQWRGEEIAIAGTGAHGLLGHHVRSRRRQANPLPPKTLPVRLYVHIAPRCLPADGLRRHPSLLALWQMTGWADLVDQPACRMVKQKPEARGQKPESTMPPCPIPHPPSPIPFTIAPLAPLCPLPTTHYQAFAAPPTGCSPCLHAQRRLVEADCQPAPPRRNP